MNTASTGFMSVQAMGFSHGIFAPSFLSLLQTQQGSGQVLHRILTQGQKVPSVSFSGCLQPGCQRGFLQRDFWLAPADPDFQVTQRTTVLLFLPQDCQLWPNSPGALHKLQDHACPGTLLSCSGGDGTWLLSLLLPHLQSQHRPAVQVWGRKGSRH